MCCLHNKWWNGNMDDELMKTYSPLNTFPKHINDALTYVLTRSAVFLCVCFLCFNYIVLNSCKHSVWGGSKADPKDGFNVTTGLGAPQDPPGGAWRCSWERDVWVSLLDLFPLRPDLVKQKIMNGWTLNRWEPFSWTNAGNLIFKSCNIFNRCMIFETHSDMYKK